jgi:hypothetical protein
MVHVPVRCVKDKHVDYDREIFCLLGHGVQIKDWHFQPPSLGVWALWEIVDNAIIHGDPAATMGDLWRLLWINDARRDAVPVVAQWVADGKPGIGTSLKTQHMLDIKAGYHRDKVLPSGILNPDVQASIYACIALSMSGYEMIPGGASTSEYLFGGEMFGYVCRTSITNADEVIWDVPMTLLGHVAANQAQYDGAKGIGRPKDLDDLKIQMESARERERTGKLHPWQKAEPEYYPLTPEQSNFPKCVAAWERAYKKTHRSKRGVKN